MKTKLLTFITATVLTLSGMQMVSAQTKENAISLNAANLNTVDMHNYEAFKKSVKPLIEKMGVKKIVGLGEGTHGTSEFYKLRFWISRILVEEKGFNHIAFENDLSDSWLLNRKLNGTADLSTLMRQYLLKIWQNEETRELLAWVKDYNKKHIHKVIIGGLDYVYLRPDVEMLKQLLITPSMEYLGSIPVIENAARYQDSCWEGTNRSGFTYDDKVFSKNAYDGYVAAEKLDKKISGSSLPARIKSNSHLALVNIKEAFAPFYDEVAKLPEASRDSLMAYNTSLIMKERGVKMIIWAHDVHLAKTGIYNNEVGGTGGMILKMFPHNYFALGTGTATGTFAATKEPRDTYTNPMNAYPLEKPIAGSWEELLGSVDKPAFYFIPAQINPQKAVKPFRVIGYNPDSGPKSYDNLNLTDLFDAFIFIKDTHAATPLK